MELIAFALILAFTAVAAIEHGSDSRPNDERDQTHDW
jgi:hypothetical protein